MCVMLVKRLFELTPEACQELKKVDKYDFDVFNLRLTTNGNELITILPYLLAKNGFFPKCKMPDNAFWIDRCRLERVVVAKSSD